MALGEDVGVKVSLGVGAPRRQVAQLAAFHRGQRVDRQGQRGLGKRRLHVGEVEAVRVLPVELEDFIAGVETCRERTVNCCSACLVETVHSEGNNWREFHLSVSLALRPRCCDFGVQRILR